MESYIGGGTVLLFLSGFIGFKELKTAIRSDHETENMVRKLRRKNCHVCDTFVILKLHINIWEKQAFRHFQ